MNPINMSVFYELRQRNSYFEQSLLAPTEAEQNCRAYSEPFGEKLKASAGLRFLFLAHFHNAIIKNVRKTAIRGKDALELDIAFETGANFFKKGFRKFRFQFVKVASGLSFPDGQTPNAVYFVKELQIRERDGLVELAIEWFAFTENSGYDDTITLAFTDIIVRPL